MLVSTMNEAQTGWRPHHSPADSVADLNNNICGTTEGMADRQSCENACSGLIDEDALSHNIPVNRGIGPFDFREFPFYP